MAKIQDFRKLNTTALVKKNTRAIARTATKKKGKKVEKKRNTRTTFVTMFFIVLILIGAGVGCLFTPAFNLSEILIEDGTNVTKSEILEKMGNIEGTNILKINTSQIEESIETLAYIKKVNIHRRFPDKLKVDYEERKPYVFIKHLESYVLMDKFGYVLETKKEATIEDLPIVYGIEIENYKPNQQLKDEEKFKYDNLVFLLETVDNIDFKYTITEINYDNIDSLIISVKELDIEINYGNIDKKILNEKVNYLKSVLKKLDGQKGRLNISSENYLEKTIFEKK